jgi:adenylate kinase
VIYIDVQDETIIKRLSSRRECSCGSVYNMITNPPKNDEICDKCGKKLYVRKDDNPETIKNRLKVYNEQTKPLIDYYTKKKLLVKVDGEKGIDDIFDDIMNILKNK